MMEIFQYELIKRKEIAEIEDGLADKENNVLKNAKKTMPLFESRMFSV